MTTEKVIEMVNDAYRRGYLDGMNDRKEAPVPVVDVPGEAVADKLAEALQNLMSYDGTPQLERTKE